MEKIDLTRCSNCRAWVRYRYDRVYEDTGRIEKVTEEGGEVRMRFVADEDGELITMWEDGKICEHIMDFEIIPRAPETYKDWQVGDIIGFEDENGEIDIIPEHLCRVIFRSGELVAIADNCEDADINGVYTCSQLYRECCRLVLTDIEKKIIEEKKKAEYKPQDGDICFVKSDSGNSFVFIKRDGDDEYGLSKYASIDTNSRYLWPAKVKYVCRKEDIRELRPATEEEKQCLFDAMAKTGKRWNAEKKVVEDIPKPYEFRKGEPVLVRRDVDENWRVRVYLCTNADNTYRHKVTSGNISENYQMCIPYNERTMHLLGTAEDYKEGE